VAATFLYLRYEDFIMTTCTTVEQIGVGIDTARYGHRVTFLRDDRQPAAKPLTVTEDQNGYQQLRQRLEELNKQYPEAQIRVHIDAAGQYATNLERFLRSLPWPMTISIGEPKRNKDYHKAISPKRTTDDTESHAMARFAIAEQPAPTPEVPDDFYVLREIASRLEGQVRDTTRAVNRLHNLMARVFPELATLVNNFAVEWLLRLLEKYPTPQRIEAARFESLKKIPYLKEKLAKQIQDAARHSIGTLNGEVAEAMIKQCLKHLRNCKKTEKNLEELMIAAYQALPASGHRQLKTIPGIGVISAAVLVAKMISIERFESPEKLVGYFGIFPEENTSGVERDGKPIPPGTMRMSRKGADLVRRYLWNAAKSAMTHNPAVRDLYARLRAKGTRGDVALGHCMRKLLHQGFGVWASDHPFDEERSRGNTKRQQAEADSSTSKIETVAGHKREIIPTNKVVTATVSKVKPSPTPIKTMEKEKGPGSIDYAYVREQITIKQILSHLGLLEQLRCRGHEYRGPCPFHASANAKSTSFAVNLDKNVFHCHNAKCDKAGNVLDFWKAYHGMSLYESTLALAETFKLQLTRNRREEAPVIPEPVTQHHP